LVVAIVAVAITVIIQQGQTQNTTGVTKQDNTYTGLKNLTGKTAIPLGQNVVLTLTENKPLTTFVALPNGSTITQGTTKYTKTNGIWNDPNATIVAGTAIIVYAPGSGTVDFEAVLANTPQAEISCATLGIGIKTIYDTTSSTDQNVFCGASGKTWTKVASTTMTQANAIAYCDGLVYANFSDWRLPSCTTKNLGQGCELYVSEMDICGWDGLCGQVYIWNGSAYTITNGSPTSCNTSYPNCLTQLNQLDRTQPFSYYWANDDSTYMSNTLGRILYYYPSTTLLRAVRCVR